MLRHSGGAAAAALLIATALTGLPARAQSSGPGWFTPKAAGGGGQSAPPPAAHRVHHLATQPAPVADPVEAGPGDPQQAAAGGPAVAPVLPQPPVPVMGALPKGGPPPAAIIGVISVPDIMRQSTAALEVQKEIVARRDKLRDDVQREQMVLRDMQQSLQDAHGLSQDQARTRIHGLQERENEDKRKFQDRQRVVQEALQVALNQIERELVQVIRQVADSHNMNLVLHQEQIALNVQGFDITAQVLSQLNAVLPSVFIPADGVDPEQLARQGTFPTTAAATATAAGNATPVSAPGPAAAPTRGK